MAYKLIFVLGVIQIVAGVVLLGLFSADYYENVTKREKDIGLGPIKGHVSDQTKAGYFGPILVSILVAVNGIIGIIADHAGKPFFNVLYLMGAAISATASSTLVWLYSIKLVDCIQGVLQYVCSEETKKIRGTTLAFSSIAFVVGMIGMVVIGLQMCKK